MCSLACLYVVATVPTATAMTRAERALVLLVAGLAFASLAWVSARPALVVYPDGVLARGWVRTRFVEWDRIDSFATADDLFGFDDSPAVLKTVEGRLVPLTGLARREGEDLADDLDGLRHWLELARAHGGRLPDTAA